MKQIKNIYKVVEQTAWKPPAVGLFSESSVGGVIFDSIMPQWGVMNSNTLHAQRPLTLRVLNEKCIKSLMNIGVFQKFMF